MARQCSIQSAWLTNELMDSLLLDSLLSYLMACSSKPFHFPWHPYLGNPSRLKEINRKV
jgi:hypothetical protein